MTSIYDDISKMVIETFTVRKTLCDFSVDISDFRQSAYVSELNKYRMNTANGT